MTQLSISGEWVLPRDVIAEANAKAGVAPGLWSRLESVVREHGDRTAFAARQGGAWKSMTFAEVDRAARELASALIEFGFSAGDRIAILCGSRPEWAIGFYAALGTGGVVVPLDSKLSAAELIPIVKDAAPNLLMISPEFEDIADELVANTSVGNVILMADDSSRYGSYRHLSARRSHPMRQHLPNELAVLTYTSGTTGEPKGVMTTMGNLVHQIDAIGSVCAVTPDDRFVSILPMNHLFELTGGMLMPLCSGAKVAYVGSLFPTEIADAMQMHAATKMLVVPLFLRMVKKGIERTISKMSLAKRLVFKALFALMWLLPFSAVKRRVFGAIHDQFGGALDYFVAGGAALDVETISFFDRLGLPILQGYGLTETSPVCTVNPTSDNRPGSVGKPLEDVEIRITGDGEILVRGPNLMRGYYKRPDLTREVVDSEGWLHTGDRGYLDEDGFLYITGRIKNLIVLGSGKNVQPEEVESRLESEAFDEVCVLGVAVGSGMREGCEEVCAVVVPTEEMKLRHNGELSDVARNHVMEMSRALADYKRPTQVFVSPTPLPKTATQKVKRRDVARWIHDTHGARS